MLIQLLMKILILIQEFATVTILIITKNSWCLLVDTSQRMRLAMILISWLTINSNHWRMSIEFWSLWYTLVSTWSNHKCVRIAIWIKSFISRLQIHCSRTKSIHHTVIKVVISINQQKLSIFELHSYFTKIVSHVMKRSD